MANWDSNLGVWKPAKERAVNIRTGELYEGPDRAALEVLKQEGVSSLGMDARKDPENIMRARQLGMTVEEWLKMHEPPTPETLAEAEKNKDHVVTYEEPKKKAPVRPQGGGVNIEGGFGDIPK